MTARAQPLRVNLDDYYASRPDTRPAMRWPIHRDFFCLEKPIAWFDSWGEAADFAMANDLFMGEPRRAA